MKIKKLLNKTIKRHALRAKKAFKKSYRYLVFKNKYSRVIRKYLKMEAHKAFKHGFRFTQDQIEIRPRIRLFAKATLVLIIALFLTNKASAYFKARESEIKVNGQAILVAKTSDSNRADETTLQASINAKRSPFDFRMPVKNGLITQGFSSYHRAIDIAAPYGSPIYPLGSGTVTFTGFMADGHGNTVVIDHGDGLKSLYAHMSKITVGVGNRVSETTTIGDIGLTGHTTGPHVHVEVYDSGITINPESVLPDN